MKPDGGAAPHTILPEIDILLEDDGWPQTDALQRRLREALAVLFAHSPADNAVACLLLSSDKHVQQLNRDFRGQDKPTNVLSFSGGQMPDADERDHLGDVILARETIMSEAQEAGIAFADHAVHLTLHGFLHLLGHDHIEEAQARRMESLETQLLAQLGIADPYSIATRETK